MTFIKRMLGLCALTATLALAGGCSNYTYFNVGVYLNQQDKDDNIIDSQLLQAMSSCTVAVFAGGKQIERSNELTTANGVNGICKPGFNGDMAVVNDTRVMKVGVLDYSSARQSGDIQFVVTVRSVDGDQKPVIAQGRATAGVSSGSVLEVPLIIGACSTNDHKKGQSDCSDIN